MSFAATIRIQVESALAHKIPSALTPPVRVVRPVAPTGIGPLDALVQGGLPIGAITELVGEVCSGRMSLALSFLSQVTAAEKVCAWIDASNTFNPAAASGAGDTQIHLALGMLRSETRDEGTPRRRSRHAPA
jgi:recombination protein RecA